MGYFWVVHEVAAIVGDKVVDACLHGGEDNRNVGFMLDDVLVPFEYQSGAWIAKDSAHCQLQSLSKVKSGHGPFPATAFGLCDHFLPR